jgi:hypothetical protein
MLTRADVKTTSAFTSLKRQKTRAKLGQLTIALAKQRSKSEFL